MVKNKKVLILLGVISLLIIFFLSLLLIKTKPSNNTTATSNSIPAQTAPPTVYKTNEPTSNEWNTYKNPDFTIQYPSNWKIKETKEGLIKRFVMSALGKTYPNFGGQIAPLLTVSTDNLLNLYRQESYYSGTCTLGQQPCTYFLTYGKKMGTEHIQEIAVISSHNGQSYFFRYLYMSVARRNEDETMMNSFLRTFSFP